MSHGGKNMEGTKIAYLESRLPQRNNNNNCSTLKIGSNLCVCSANFKSNTGCWILLKKEMHRIQSTFVVSFERFTIKLNRMFCRQLLYSLLSLLLLLLLSLLFIGSNSKRGRQRRQRGSSQFQLIQINSTLPFQFQIRISSSFAVLYYFIGLNCFYFSSTESNSFILLECESISGNKMKGKWWDCELKCR